MRQLTTRTPQSRLGEPVVTVGASRPRRAPWLTGIALAAVLSPAQASAHELGIDELRLWVAPSSGELRAQLTFDPELTRSLDDTIPDELKRERIREFVTRQLRIDIDGQGCAPALTVRELYERGGAAPGDVVMLACQVSNDSQLTVKVTIGAALPALVVQGVGMTLAASDATVGSPSAAALAPALATINARGMVSFQRLVDGARAGAPAHSPTPTTLLPLAKGFFERGLEHVLPSGLDHLLFVASLTLGTQSAPRRLAGLLGLFTLAHTAAVAWAAKGAWVPAPNFVEPCIAASIAVAGFAVYRRVDAWHASPLVVLFGLIHGLGFAGGIAALQPALPSFLVSVVAFNLGVEAAQAVAVLVVLGLLFIAKRLARPTDRLTTSCALAITGVGAVWTALRIFAALTN